MARKRLVCPSCETKISPGAFCANCGSPTSEATHQERILWELGQWETSRRDVPKPPPQTIVLTRLAAARIERQTAQAKRNGSDGRRTKDTEPDRSFEMKPVTVENRHKLARFAPRRGAAPVEAPQTAAVAGHPPAAGAAPTIAAQAPAPQTSVAGPPAVARPRAQKLDSGAIVERLARAAARGVTLDAQPATETARLLREAAADAADAVAEEAIRETSKPGARTGVMAARAQPRRALDPPQEAREPDPAPVEPGSPAVEPAVTVERSEKPARAGRRAARREAKALAKRAKLEAAEEATRVRLAAAEDARRAREAAAEARKAEAEARAAERLEAERRKKEAGTERRRGRRAAATVAAEPTRPAEPAELAEPKARRTRTERRVDRAFARLGPKHQETVTTAMEGRSGVHHVMFLVTRYRVAVVPRSHRAPVRWIPLEEVKELSSAWRGAPTIILDHPIEHLTFRKRSPKPLEPLLEVLREEVRAARRSPGTYHSAEIDQEWCDRANEVWDSDSGRLRLWIRRHPVFTVAWLASIVPVAYVIAAQAHL